MEIECLVLSLILPPNTPLWLFSTETEGDRQRRNTHTGTQMLNSQNGGMHLPKIYNFMPGANMWLYFPPLGWTCAVTAKIDLLFVGNYTQFPLVCAGENSSPNLCSQILASGFCFISVVFFFPHKYLLSTYYVPGTGLVMRNITLSKSLLDPCLCEAFSLGCGEEGKINVNQILIKMWLQLRWER